MSPQGFYFYLKKVKPHAETKAEKALQTGRVCYKELFIE